MNAESSLGRLRRNQADSLMCRCVSGEAADPAVIRADYSEVGDDLLWRLASANRVAMAAARRLRQAEIEDLPSRWGLAESAAAAGVERVLSVASKACERLKRSGFRTVVLENAAIAAAVPSSRSGFDFGDADIYCEPGYTRAVRSLVAEGFREEQRHGTGEETGGRRILVFREAGEKDVRVNLQPGLVARRWLPVVRGPNFEEIYARSRAVDRSLAIPGPEDLLFQLCVHSAAHAFVRTPGIRLHMDLDWFIRASTINWDVFLQLVERHRVRTTAFFALALPLAVLGTPVPVRVLNQLRPVPARERRLAAYLESSGLFEPPHAGSALGYFSFIRQLNADDPAYWRDTLKSWVWPFVNQQEA